MGVRRGGRTPRRERGAAAAGATSATDRRCRERDGRRRGAGRRRRETPATATEPGCVSDQASAARRWPVLLCLTSFVAGAGAAGAAPLGSRPDAAPSLLRRSAEEEAAARRPVGGVGGSFGGAVPDNESVPDDEGAPPPLPLSPFGIAVGGGPRDPFLAALSGGGQSEGGGSQQQHRMVELYENEHFDPSREAWVSGPGLGSVPASLSGERWTSPSASGKKQIKSPPPAEVVPPVGTEFESDWKIDVTGAGVRDNLGWEYLWDARGRSGRRRRRWLRTVGPKAATAPEAKGREKEEREKIEAKKGAAAAAAKVSPPKKRRKPRPLLLDPLRPVRAVRSEWNFKGFGWSFYKSLLFPRGCGVSFRLPLSAQFDWYDRHPALPSVTSSAGVYYPNWTAAVFLNCSVHVAVMKHLVRRSWEWTAFVVRTALVLARVAVEVAAFPLSALLRAAWDMASRALGDDDNASSSAVDNSKPKSKTSAAGRKAVVLLGHPLPPPPPPRRVRYSADVEERVGVSVSWRVSERRGYEFRISYWHLFLPTLMHLGGLVGRALDRAAAAAAALDKAGEDADEAKRPPRSSSRRNLFRDKALVEYLRRRSGSLGVAWGGPNPDPPRLSCSAVLSLSGYFYDINPLLGGRRRRGGPTTARRSSGPTAAAAVASDASGKKAASSTAAAARTLKASSAAAADTKKDPVVGMEERILAGKERAEGALERREGKAGKEKRESGGGGRKKMVAMPAAEAAVEAEEGGKKVRPGEEEEEASGDEKAKVAS